MAGAQLDSRGLSDISVNRHADRPMGTSLAAFTFVGVLHVDRRILLAKRLGNRCLHRLHADVIRGLLCSGEEVAIRTGDLDVCRPTRGAPGAMLDVF